jgi:hypothetical protein
VSRRPDDPCPWLELLRFRKTGLRTTLGVFKKYAVLLVASVQVSMVARRGLPHAALTDKRRSKSLAAASAGLRGNWSLAAKGIAR